MTKALLAYLYTKLAYAYGSCSCYKNEIPLEEIYKDIHFYREQGVHGDPSYGYNSYAHRYVETYKGSKGIYESVYKTNFRLLLEEVEKEQILLTHIAIHFKDISHDVLHIKEEAFMLPEVETDTYIQKNLKAKEKPNLFISMHYPYNIGGYFDVSLLSTRLIQVPKPSTRKKSGNIYNVHKAPRLRNSRKESS